MTLVQCSTRLWKSQVFLSGIKISKRVTRTWKMMKEVVIPDHTELMKMVKRFRIWCIQTVNQVYYWKFWSSYMELCAEKCLNFGPKIGFSIITKLQLTGHCLSNIFWPKNQLLNWNTHPVSLILLQWLLALSRNKVCLKGMKILDINVQKKWWCWKLFHSWSSRNVSNSGSIVVLSL